MEIYLPIAELPINMFMIFGMGAAIGFLSGLFGIGGGFLLTPLLLFIGIPPAVAVATVSTQVVASSFSGALSYQRRDAIDYKLAFVLFAAGIVGTAIGVWLFAILRNIGQLDLVISTSYVALLSVIGFLMLFESFTTMLRRRSGKRSTARRPGRHNWVHGLPLKIRFRRSKLYVSLIPVVLLGATIGFLGAILGIGGGFIMVPALIYLLRVPTNVVIGTSLLQILVTMSAATVMHAITNQSVDIVLGIILMVGGVIGAQFGAQVGFRLKGDQLRALLGILVLTVGLRFAGDLFTQPDDLFSVSEIVDGLEVEESRRR